MAERTSIISHPPREYFIAIRAPYLTICEDNHCAAMLLAVFEYFTNSVYTDAESRDQKVTEPWMEISRSALSSAMMGLYSSRTVFEALQFIASKGFIVIDQKSTVGGGNWYCIVSNTIQSAIDKVGNGKYGRVGFLNHAKLHDWDEDTSKPIETLAIPIVQNCTAEVGIDVQNCTIPPLVYKEEEEELKPLLSASEENTTSTPLAEKQDSSGETYSDMVLYLKSTLRDDPQRRKQKLNTKPWQGPLERLYDFWVVDQAGVKVSWARALAGGKAHPVEYALTLLRAEATGVVRRKPAYSASPAAGGTLPAGWSTEQSEPAEMAEFYKLVPSAKPTLRWDPKPWVRKALLNSRMFDDWTNKFAEAAALAETLSGTDYNQPIHFEWFVENWDRLLAGYFDNWLKPKKKTMAEKHAEVTNMDLGDINSL